VFVYSCEYFMCTHSFSVSFPHYSCRKRKRKKKRKQKNNNQLEDDSSRKFALFSFLAIPISVLFW